MTIDIKDIFKKKNEEESIDFDNIYKNIISISIKSYSGFHKTFLQQ